jgi:citrate lyase subunit beta/citryl-CoA lyase
MSRHTEHAEATARARSFLFVPGNRPERFAKAMQSAADAVVVDLEDAVPPEEKAAARDAMRREWPWLARQKKPVVVRINPAQTEDGTADLQCLQCLQTWPIVMVAKADSAASLHRVNAMLENVPLLPLIESAEGFHRLEEVAGSPHVLRLVVGHIDFMVDTGVRCSPDQRELDPLRFAVAVQSRVHRLAPPVDGVTLGVDDADTLRDDTLRALRFGFGAKLCIHPRQVAPVHAALAPSDAEVEWARRVIAGDEASGGAAFKLDGRMVDLPVVLQARITLDRLRT